MKTPPAWFPNWTGEAVVIVAGGPSAKDVPLEQARDRAKFIAINTSYRLAPWADVLYACDANWWIEHKGAPTFAGLKVSQDKRAAQIYRHVRHVTSVRGIEHLVLDQPGLIGWGGNSGFHAINLAVQWGANKLILVGYDMNLKGGSHWHGDHTGRCSNPNAQNVERWRRVVDAAAPTLAKLGVKVFNCSPVSSLMQYEKLEFQAALDA